MAGAALKPGYFYNHPFIFDKTIFMRKQLNKYAAMREIINFIIVVLLWRVQFCWYYRATQLYLFLSLVQIFERDGKRTVWNDTFNILSGLYNN